MIGLGLARGAARETGSMTRTNCAGNLDSTEPRSDFASVTLKHWRRRMVDVSKIMSDLQQTRDEMKLQLHLASKDAEDEWEDLMAEWDKFLSKSEFEKTGEEVGESARQLGLRMKAAYDSLKK